MNIKKKSQKSNKHMYQKHTRRITIIIIITREETTKKNRSFFNQFLLFISKNKLDTVKKFFLHGWNCVPESDMIKQENIYN